MKTAITSPFQSISDRMASHRSSQAIIYADMLKQTGHSVSIDFGNKFESFDEYDTLAVYHGNDFGGALNIFGGLKNLDVAEQIVKFSKFKGTVISLGIDYPDYTGLLKSRMKAGYPEIWDQVDFDNLDRMKNESVLFTNPISDKIVIGDSHAISLYRPGWQMLSIPFKTLNGVLNGGIEKLIPSTAKEVEFLFGAIDIRHHLCRVSSDHRKNATDLANRYINSIQKIDPDIKTVIYVPLPLESEERKIPTTGCYKGQPFWGSLVERNIARKAFIDTLTSDNTIRIDVKDPWSYLLNDKNELDMEKMEKPRSVHLSREFYPFWQGKNFQPKKEIKTTRSLV